MSEKYVFSLMFLEVESQGTQGRISAWNQPVAAVAVTSS